MRVGLPPGRSALSMGHARPRPPSLFFFRPTGKSRHPGDVASLLCREPFGPGLSALLAASPAESYRMWVLALLRCHGVHSDGKATSAQGTVEGRSIRPVSPGTAGQPAVLSTSPPDCRGGCARGRGVLAVVRPRVLAAGQCNLSSLRLLFDPERAECRLWNPIRVHLVTPCSGARHPLGHCRVEAADPFDQNSNLAPNW